MLTGWFRKARNDEWATQVANRSAGYEFPVGAT